MIENFIKIGEYRKPKEFPIVDFDWIYGEGNNFPKQCTEVEYTYQEGFERNCK